MARFVQSPSVMQNKVPPVAVSDPTSLEGQSGDRDRRSLGELAEDDPRALEGKLVAERYEVEELLGVGGMGCVYRARHIHIRKHVALKTLHASMLRSPEAVARFEREAIAAARIDHPNVVVATDFGHLPSGHYYLVLEFVQGHDLRHELDQAGQLEVPRALAIGRQIASALSAAHPLGIVHRDLKPENVMLVERPGTPDLVKVLDFGIAKITLEDKNQPLTQLGAVFGTPQYMSPEQAGGRAVDGRSDLYSLGIILYEMVSGRLPFEAADALGFIMQQLAGTPAPLPVDIPETLRALIGSMLSKDPAERPQAAADVVVALDRIAIQLRPRTSLMARAHVDDLAGHLRGAAASVWAALKQPRRVGKFSLPLGAWLLCAAIPLGALGLAFSGNDTSEHTVAQQPRPTDVTPAASSTLPSLSESDFAVEVERIELLKVYQRTENDWMLLARGSAKLGRHEQTAMAYQALLSLRADLRKDGGLLRDLLAASEDPKAFRVVLNLAESVLGRHGVDLIWEMWQKERYLPERKEQAEKLAKKLVILSRQASPALRVAIELTFTSNCEKLLTILNRAATEADERSHARLIELGVKTGCGPNRDADCFPCLRASPLLEQATARAKANPAPALGTTKED